MRGSKLFTMSLAVLLVGLLAWSAQAQFPKEGTTFGATAPATTFTQVAYSDEGGMLIVYHVLRPPSHFTSDLTGVVYRFRDDATGDGCPRLRPVFPDGEALRDDTPTFLNLTGDSDNFSTVGDRARREILDVFFLNGCPSRKTQPRSEEEVLALEAAGDVAIEPANDFVNAPSVPSPKAVPDADYWEAPPNGWSPIDGTPSINSNADNMDIKDVVTNDAGQGVGLPTMIRPRHKGFMGGKSVWYITYEICSDSTWSNTGFCSGEGVKDIFLVRYGSSLGENDMTNVAFGTPFPKGTASSPSSEANYSPIWKGACAGGNHSGNDRGFPGADKGHGPAGFNCFGPTPQEVKEFATANNISFSGDEDLDANDPRRGIALRQSSDFLLLAGMGEVDGDGGFNATTAETGGKVKVINCPIFAADLNMDRKFTQDEIITFPNNVLEASVAGEFNTVTVGGRFRNGNP